jgi:hypothetical protein
MKPLGIQIALLVAISAGVACCTSCKRAGSAGTSTPSASKFIKPTPEESLTFIMDTFRRRMEETPIGFVIADSNGRSTMTGTNKVSYELIQPAAADDKLKAVVTVTSQSRYSIKRSKENADDKQDDQNAKKAASLPDPNDEKNGVESFDPSFSGKQPVESSSPSPSTSRTGEDVVARRPEEETRKYELDYVDGRWKLVTELSPDTESSIQNAFTNALDTQ